MTTAKITLEINKATTIAHALQDAGEAGLAQELLAAVEAVAKAASKRADDEAKEAAREERIKQKVARRERRAAYERDVLKHCRHLNRSRMAWVMERIGTGMTWSNSTKTAMAYAIIDALAEGYGHGSACLTLPIAEDQSPEGFAAAIDKVMLPFRMQRGTKGGPAVRASDLDALKARRDDVAARAKRLSEYETNGFAYGGVRTLLDEIARIDDAIRVIAAG